jgi:hypothetical protein
MMTHTFLRRRIAMRLAAHAAETARIAAAPDLVAELSAMRAVAEEGAAILALYIATQESERVAEERAAAGLTVPDAR